MNRGEIDKHAENWNKAQDEMWGSEEEERDIIRGRGNGQ